MGIIMHKGVAYGGGGIDAIADASDVNLSSPVDGQILRYDAQNEEWVNASLGTAASKNVGVANGVAELDTNGKVPSSQLPSYVDDTIEGYYNSEDGKFYEEDTYQTEIDGETGKIYVSLDTNRTYRWSGSAFVEISASLALGETSSTAYRGDRGKTAYDHATESGKISSAVSSGLYKVAGTAQGHIASLTAVQKSDITALGIPAQDTTYQSKTAAEGGTDVSLVTTGEKYSWNSKASDAPTFTEASTRTNIASGETQSTLFGKIMKWFSDLKDLAFVAKDGTSSTKYLRGDATWQSHDDVTHSFSQASSRANLTSGEKISVSLGKIMKWFADLKDLAFIAKDGTSSTKYLRGDGTWQAFPTIPTVNNGTLTIQKNGTQVATFTANQSGNATANITVPTGDLASINKDGTSSTKYLRGDGTWQTFPTIPAAQVNSDWNASSGVAQILNKPTIPDAQIQSDWNQTTTTAKDYIKNKPTIPNVTTKYDSSDTAETTLADDDKLPFYDTSASGRRNSTWANIKAKLKSYFDGIYSTFSGSYNDLTNKPTIPTSLDDLSDVVIYNPQMCDHLRYDSNTKKWHNEGKNFILYGGDTSVWTAIYSDGMDDVYNQYRRSEMYFTDGYSDKRATLAPSHMSANVLVKLPSNSGTLATQSWVTNNLISQANDTTAAWYNIKQALNNASPYNHIVVVGSDGVFEVGRYMDWHSTALTSKDYNYRLQVGSTDNTLYGSGPIATGSSRVFKKNIESIEDAEALKILQLNPVKFDFKQSEKDEQTERGFIAEEVKEILPNLVSETDDENCPYAINYSAIIPYLVKVVQNQQKEIDELKKMLSKT